MSPARHKRLLIPEVSLLRIVLSLAFIYAAVVGWVWVVADSMIFLPPAPSYRDTPNVLRFTTAGGERIAAVYLRTLGDVHGALQPRQRGRPGRGAAAAARPADLGFSVFAYGYRGYGL